ncbi:hypothetical protein SprV_0200857300 [Sparganum proliferum]
MPTLSTGIWTFMQPTKSYVIMSVWLRTNATSVRVQPGERVGASDITFTPLASVECRLSSAILCHRRYPLTVSYGYRFSYTLPVVPPGNRSTRLELVSVTIATPSRLCTKGCQFSGLRSSVDDETIDHH